MKVKKCLQVTAKPHLLHNFAHFGMNLSDTCQAQLMDLLGGHLGGRHLL